MIRTKNLIHPGEILKEEFLDPMGISQNRLALDLHVPAPSVNGIVRGKRAITADTAVRLGVYFGTGPEFWQNLQSHYDLCLLIVNKQTKSNLIHLETALIVHGSKKTS